MTNTYRSVQHRRNHNQTSAYKRLFVEYKAKAKHKDLDFNLDFNQFKRLIKSNCYICDKAPCLLFKRVDQSGSAYYNGIDRIDSDLGYTVSNCKPCCTTCNRMKSDHKISKFKKHIKRIIDTGLLFRKPKAKIVK